MFTFIIVQAFPLPIEGTEVRVVADDPMVITYMCQLQDSLDQTRKETFVGWYHSHPFNVGINSNAFLSGVDVGTQNVWQISEDRHGKPWVAVVVDPLRSLDKGRPEIGCFRCYPVDYTPPPNTVPSGKIVTDENARVERWDCWDRYYELDVKYFMNSLARDMMQVLAKDFLWKRILSSTPLLEKERLEQFPEKVETIATALERSEAGVSTGRGTRSFAERKTGDTDIDTATHSGRSVALENCQEQASQITKQLIFN